MKSLIFLAIVITSLIVQAQGCSISEMGECMPSNMDCASLLKALKCYRACGAEFPKALEDSMKEHGCGASALTNLGLPVMLLVALAAFFNK